MASTHGERVASASGFLIAAVVALTAMPAVSWAQQRLALDEARSQWEFSCAIRKDKFAYVLPDALRRNDVDMWIVLDRGRGSEPMVRDFGPDTSNGNGIFVFTDRGDRIETAALGGETEMIEACGAYDVVGSIRDLAVFVRERDPQRIALNFLDHENVMEGLFLADGLSHSDFGFLAAELGEPYASRFVSARHVIADFRGPRVATEIVEFSKVADLTRRYLERALSNEVITVGKTSQLDIAWWLEEQRERLGVERGWFPTVYLHLPDGGEIAASDRVVQPGDVMQIDWGIGRNNFYTDMKRFAYVLRDGETEVPPGIRHAFEVSKAVGEIVRRNVTTDVVGQVQLDRLKQIRSDLPAITHVDYSARVQTVDAERHGMYYRVIKAFHEKTGCPVIINTSFNIRGEPIVCRPEEAYRCFMFTHMDALVLGNRVFLKEDQPSMQGADEYKSQFKLD